MAFYLIKLVCVVLEIRFFSFNKCLTETCIKYIEYFICREQVEKRNLVFWIGKHFFSFFPQFQIIITKIPPNFVNLCSHVFIFFLNPQNFPEIMLIRNHKVAKKQILRRAKFFVSEFDELCRVKWENIILGGVEWGKEVR